MSNSTVFEVFGYHRDYWVNSKYVGSVRLSKPDRDRMGYGGRVVEQLDTAVTLDNGKTLQAGVQVSHECIPLCGKIKGSTLEERIAVLADYYQRVPYKR
jgi:hypothetical protein